MAQASSVADAMSAALVATSSWSRSPPRATSRTSHSSSLGGTGVFVSALRDALADGARSTSPCTRSRTCRPLMLPELELIADPSARGPARRPGRPRRARRSATLPPVRRVGTGSPRRAAQLKSLRPDLDVVDIRGNVDTRLGLVTEGELDAVVLATGWSGPPRTPRRRHRGDRPVDHAARPWSGCAGGREPVSRRSTHDLQASLRSSTTRNPRRRHRRASRAVRPRGGLLGTCRRPRGRR